MKAEYKYCLTGVIVVLIVEALGAWASANFNFNYILFSPVILVIYGTTGYHITKVRTLKVALILTSILGFFDSTVGWKISMSLNANTGNINNYPNSVQWIITVIVMTIFAGLIGLIGGLLTRLIRRA